ncbi:hypothetical protein [Rhizobium sp.]|uniref:hypothetical protein n=1 Tax=Rhizobium sp. TaxID=391 RepID=UPI0028A712B6
MNDVDRTVGELLRAANRILLLPPLGIADIIFRAIVAIRDLRVAAGIPGTGTSQDAIIRLAEVAANPTQFDTGQKQDALLEAADMIRTLRIVAHSGISLRLAVIDHDEVAT